MLVLRGQERFNFCADPIIAGLATGGDALFPCVEAMARICFMQSKATTVKQYLAGLPPDRRAAISAVREVILKNLDKDYEEGMQYGMIGYYVPHRVFPAGYHCDPAKPLPFACLASQKNHMSLSLMTNYGGGEEEKWFRAAWARTDKKLDMGACCVRFKKIEDVPLDVIAEAIRRVPVSRLIAHYESMLASRGKSPSKPARKRPASESSSKAVAGKKSPAKKKTAGRT